VCDWRRCESAQEGVSVDPVRRPEVEEDEQVENRDGEGEH